MTTFSAPCSTICAGAGCPAFLPFTSRMAATARQQEAAIFQGLGARAGVPDIIVVHQGRCFAIELKTEAGRLTIVQREAIAPLERGRRAHSCMPWSGCCTASAGGLGTAEAVKVEVSWLMSGVKRNLAWRRGICFF